MSTTRNATDRDKDRDVSRINYKVNYPLRQPPADELSEVSPREFQNIADKDLI